MSRRCGVRRTCIGSAHGNDSWILGFLVVVGIPLFLLLNHPWIFWLVYVPLTAIIITSMVLFFKKGGCGMVIIALLASITIIIVTMVVCIPPKCEHKVVTRYSFSMDDSMVHNNVCSYCAKCDTRLTPYSLFQGELVDKSYLEAIQDNSDGSEILPGEYYTVTARVPLGFMDSIGLTCEVENEDFLLRFSVVFRAEFKEQLSLIEKGQEITFRGRFSDEGCYFTDCELIE